MTPHMAKTPYWGPSHINHMFVRIDGRWCYNQLYGTQMPYYGSVTSIQTAPDGGWHTIIGHGEASSISPPSHVPIF